MSKQKTDCILHESFYPHILMGYIYGIEGEMMHRIEIEAEKNLYHSEQAMLLDAHFFGRVQYLRSENRFRPA